MDCYPSSSRLTDLEEGLEDRIRRVRTVDEEEVVVFDAMSCESRGLVQLLVQSNDSGHSLFLEILDICFRCMNMIAIIDSRPRMWTTKSKESSGNNPVEVSILDPFKGLVLLHIKLIEVKKLEEVCLPNCLETVDQW